MPNVLVNGLAGAIKCYSERYEVKIESLIFVVICEENRSANFCDQNKIQRAVTDEFNGRLKSRKISYSKFQENATFEDERILLEGREVALGIGWKSDVFYRPNSLDFSLCLEKSTKIKSIIDLGTTRAATSLKKLGKLERQLKLPDV